MACLYYILTYPNPQALLLAAMRLKQKNLPLKAGYLTNI